VSDKLIGSASSSKGFAATYHAQGADWSGPTGFYYFDLGTAPPAGQSKTWTLYVWAPQIYQQDQMALAIDGRYIGTSTFALQLDAVPEGVAFAHPVGTSWQIPKDNSFSLVLPAYKTDNGLSGYRFTVTMTSASAADPNTDGGSTGPTSPTGSCLPVGAVVMLGLGVGAWLLSGPRFRQSTHPG